MAGAEALSGAVIDLATGQFTPAMHHYLAKLEKLRQQLELLTGQVGDIGGEVGTLGTAAFKDIGTSGGTVPLLNGLNIFSKAQTFEPVTLTDASSIAWDWSLGPIAKVTLGGNRTLAAPTNTNGMAGTWSLFVRQDGGGSKTLAYNSAYLFPGGTDPVLSTAANALDVLTFVTDGTSIVGAVSKAFA